MLLRITVLQYKGAPPTAALAYMFDERGGSIGREECNLTLPDPTRVLSRVQAQIVYADGLFKLVDQGGNPSVVNSLRVGKGNSRALYDGDIIDLCDYRLRVKAIGVVAPQMIMDPGPARTQSGLPPVELAPPILLDPDELTGGSPFVPPAEAPAAAAATQQPEPELEMSFDMDIDFDDITQAGAPPMLMEEIKDIGATVGIDSPFAQPAGSLQHTMPAQPEQAALHELVPALTPDTALSAFCLGLGVPVPPSLGDMQPQHVGIVMRRAMQRALAGVLSNFTPQDLARHLADQEHLQMQPPPDRKGKLWEIFEQRHAEISHTAEDHFHSLFSSEFIKAYQAQIERLREHN